MRTLLLMVCRSKPEKICASYWDEGRVVLMCNGMLRRRLRRRGRWYFFAQYLESAELFKGLCNDCPIKYRSNNAPKIRDIWGTLLLSVLNGQSRYAHITGLCGERVGMELLGMSKVVSEDSIRRALGKGPNPNFSSPAGVRSAAASCSATPKSKSFPHPHHSRKKQESSPLSKHSKKGRTTNIVYWSPTPPCRSAPSGSSTVIEPTAKTSSMKLKISGAGVAT